MEYKYMSTVIDYEADKEIKEANREDLLKLLEGGWEIYSAVSVSRSVALLGSYKGTIIIKGFIQYILRKQLTKQK